MITKNIVARLESKYSHLTFHISDVDLKNLHCAVWVKKDGRSRECLGIFDLFEDFAPLNRKARMVCNSDFYICSRCGKVHKYYGQMYADYFCKDCAVRVK